MNEQLESDLRAVLRERAGAVPDTVAARLTHVDYRPRTHRLRAPVVIGATATAAALAGTLAVVISLGAGASNAFAGWSPTPTPPAPGQLAGAQTSCEQAQSPIAGLPLQLSDTRGPFTFSIYADSTTSATCIKGPSFTAVSGSISSSPITAPAGHILLSSSHASENSGAAYTVAEGRTGTGVSGVTLRLEDGTTVQATVGNGWFVAWWPDAQAVKSAELVTSSGPVTQTLNLPPAAPSGAGGTDRQGGSMSSSMSGGGRGSETQSSFGGSASPQSSSGASSGPQ